jgi:sodium/potassium-transporting ATPase subunit beta
MAYSEKSSVYKEELIIKDRLTFTDKLNNFLLFLWNPDKKEICGRDGLSWARLGLFYACFYMFIAGVFCAMLAIFMAIIDKREPTYYNDFSVMWQQKVDLVHVGTNPGLGFRPQKDADTTLIRVKSSDKNEANPNSYMHYVRLLDDFLSTYLIVDKRGEQIINCDFNSDPAYLEQQFNLNKVCRFEIVEMFGPNNMCIQTRNYEYDKSKPCVLLKLNKIYGWRPEAYLPTDKLPAELMPYEKIVRANPRNVFILCNGEFQVDLDFTGDITYFSLTPDGSGKGPLGFIPFYYFPYKNQDGYRSPLVFAYFSNITTNVLVNVMCKAYARNIVRNNLYRIGAVHFEIMID